VHSSVAAIRAGRFPTHYVRPAAHHREPRLGLRLTGAWLGARSMSTPTGGPAARLSTRRLMVPAPISVVRRIPIRHTTQVAWARPPAGQGRRIPATSVAPWRD
jgi:hypothetical protein